MKRSAEESADNKSLDASKQTKRMRASELGEVGVFAQGKEGSVASTSHNVKDIKSIINPKVKNYFSEVIKVFGYNLDENIKLRFIVVAHVLPTLPAYIYALNKIGLIRYLIPKGSFRDLSTEAEMINYGVKLNDNITKKDLAKNSSKVVDLISSCCKEEDERCIILDIGGYFAPALPKISEHEIHEKVLGIVEDTENGHQKYQKIISKSKIPVYSVARSELKKTEDYNVGKSIVHASDTLLRKKFNKRSEDLKVIGVIGFGKIGRSIATHLRQKNINKVIVFDRDPIALIHAASLDFVTGTKDKILEECEMVYCATGNKSLSTDDFAKFQQEKVILASCTSADDELDLTGLPVPFKEDTGKRSAYSGYRFKVGSDKKKEHEVYLLCDGNAVNFYYKAIVGEYIRGVQAALLLSTLRLASQDFAVERLSEIIEIEPKEEATLARLWLKSIERLEFGLESNIPKKDDYYVGRVKEKKQLFDLLFGSSSTSFRVSYSCVIMHSKESGLGRTQLVLDFAEINKEYYDLIWLIDLSADRETAYRNLANRLKISIYGKSTKEILQEIVYKVGNKPNILLIYDNVPSAREIKNELNYIKELEGGGRRHFLILPKKFAVEDEEPGYSYYELTKLSQEDAFEYITKRVFPGGGEVSEKYKNSIKEIIKVLNAHPLCLELFATYVIDQMRRHSGGSTEKHRLFDNSVTHLYKKFETAGDLNLKDILGKLVNFHIETLSPADKKFFMFACILSNKFIPKKIIKIWGESTISANALDISETKLSKLALVKFNSNNDYYIHNWIREAFISISIVKSFNDIKEVYSEALGVLNNMFSYNYYTSTPQLVKEMTRYVDSVYELVKFKLDFLTTDKAINWTTMLGAETVSTNRLELWCKLGDYYLNEYRDYEKSKDFYKTAENELKAVCKIEDCKNELSQISSDQKWINKAAELLKAIE